MSVTDLTETQNFGEWIIKINEIIAQINSTEEKNSVLEDIIKNAQQAGQIGSPLPNPNSRNYNDYVDNGVYYIDSLGENGPEKGVPCHLYVAANIAGFVTHFALTSETTAVKFYVRALHGKKWLAWTKLITKAESDATYFPITGGTITGDLEVSGAIVGKNTFTSEGDIITLSDIRLKKPEYGVILRNEGNEFQIRVTTTNDPDGDPTILKPVIIDLSEGVCDINGTSEHANYLTELGLTHAYDDPSSIKAASGFAVSSLHDYIEDSFMKNTGGTFTGIIHFNSHIVLGYDITVYSPSNITFRPTNAMSVISNNSYSEFYIDRDNEPLIEGIPSIYGARTRTGITDFNAGTVVYDLGCLEIKEDSVALRMRKRNVTMDPPVDEGKNITLTLDKDSVSVSEDSTISLGNSAFRFSQLYASSDSINTSDENMKTEIAEIDSDLLDNWKFVEWKSFKFKDSVKKKGTDARYHTGLIAQDIAKVVDSVDIHEYGFFCYDEWDDQFDTEYMTIPEKIDEDGNVIEESRIEEIVTKRRSAGKQYSLRYQEIQAIENAYLRREIKNLKKEIQDMKKTLDIE